MSDTKEIIEYVRGCINGVQKVTFDKDTVKLLFNVLEQVEAENDRLTKMVGWLANKLIYCPTEKGHARVEGDVMKGMIDETELARLKKLFPLK